MYGKTIEMTLNDEPYFAFKNGKKCVEVRLYDEKRQAICPNDIIIFKRRGNEDEEVRGLVKALHRAESFKELFESEIFSLCGFGGASACEAVEIMHTYYTEEDEEKYGVLGIELIPVVEIYSKGDYPADSLSNFYPHEFEIDGIRCASMEGFLQSLKFRFSFIQRRICRLSGKAAKKRGTKRAGWKKRGYIRWKGEKIARLSYDFTVLTERAYACMYEQNEAFRDALNSTRGKVLTHSIGSHDKMDTILTEEEFIENLNKLRDRDN